MTQEEKAKAYDEAIEKAKDMLYYKEVRKGTIEYLFPELKESEDERIRKELCKAIWTYVPTEQGREYIAWLEKQGEQKPAWSEDVESAISLLKSMAEEQERDYCPHNANHLRKAAQYLETFRPQNTWKPSDEQIEALESVIENCAYSEYQDCLRELIGQLKRLKVG